MVDVFEETEERLRQERWATILQKNWPVLVGAVAAVVLGAGGYYGYKAYRDHTAALASEHFEKALQAEAAGNKVRVEEELALAAKSGSPAYQALSLMKQGAIKVAAGDSKAAVSLYEAAAKAAPTPILSDAAVLNASFAAMDTESFAAIEKRLKPITAEKRPYRPLAREALALAMVQAGKLKEAREEFQALSMDLDAPEGLKARAQAAMVAIDSGSAKVASDIVKSALALPKPAVAAPVAQQQAPGPQASAQ